MRRYDFGQSRLAATWRSPKDKGVEAPVAQYSVQYLSRPEQVRLPDELIKVPRAHPFGQRSLSPGFINGKVFEHIQLVHWLLVSPGRFHALRRPMSEKPHVSPRKMEFPKDKPNSNENVRIFQLFGEKGAVFRFRRPLLPVA